MNNGTIDGYANQPCYFRARFLLHGAPVTIGDFRNIFLPSIGEDQKKVLLFEHGALDFVPYGKSGPGYCITFIKRLDEGLW